MKQPLLIIIFGPPGSGKTTLGKNLAEKFYLPFFSKDELQEKIFDHLGVEDREWSVKTTFTALDQLYYIIEALLKSHHSLIVESNFMPENDDYRFKALKENYDFYPFQIMLTGNTDILFSRFLDRSNSQNRHKGHQDLNNQEEYKPRFQPGYYKKLTIGDTLYKIDTTELEKIDYNDLYSEIQQILES